MGKINDRRLPWRLSSPLWPIRSRSYLQNGFGCSTGNRKERCSLTIIPIYDSGLDIALLGKPYSGLPHLIPIAVKQSSKLSRLDSGMVFMPSIMADCKGDNMFYLAARH